MKKSLITSFSGPRGGTEEEGEGRLKVVRVQVRYFV